MALLEFCVHIRKFKSRRIEAGPDSNLADIGDFESFRYFLDRLFTERGGSRRDLDDGAEVIFECQVILREREHDGRDEREAGDMVILDGLQHVHEIEPRHGDNRVAALQLGEEDDGEAIHMEEGEGDEEGEVVVGQACGVPVGLDDAGDEVEVGEDDGFREARGARGVEECGGVGLPDADGRGCVAGREALGIGQRGAIRILRTWMGRWARAEGGGGVDDEDQEAGAGELRDEVRVREDELGARVAGLPRDLARGVGRVRGRGDSAERDNGEEEHGEVD